MRAWRAVDGGALLHILLTPKSSRDEIGEIVVGPAGLVLKAKVRAIPDKGKANQALIKLLSKSFRLPKTSFGITSGSRSRPKTVKISGDFKEISKMLETCVKLGSIGLNIQYNVFK